MPKSYNRNKATLIPQSDTEVVDHSDSDWLCMSPIRPKHDWPPTISSLLSHADVKINRREEMLMTNKKRLLNPPCRPSGVLAVTWEEHDIVGGWPPLQHEGDEKNQSWSPLGRFLFFHRCEDKYVLDLRQWQTNQCKNKRIKTKENFFFSKINIWFKNEIFFKN